MKPASRIRFIDLMVVASIVAYAVYQGRDRAPRPVVAEYTQKVDLSPLDRCAVHADGRLRSFESHAKAFMGYVAGPRLIDGQTNGFTYLDLMFRPERYADKDLIYVKNKQVRAQVIELLRAHGGVDQKRADTIMSVGLISKSLLGDANVRALLQRLGEDLIKTAKVVDAIQSAFTVSNPDFLLENLRVVAPPNGDPQTPWVSMARLVAGGAPADTAHAGMAEFGTVPGLPDGFQSKVRTHWQSLREAWRNEDAPAVNKLVGELAMMFPTVSPQLYPSVGQLAMESWYFRNKSMTWVWWFYALATAPLLMSVIYHWNGARTLGMFLFGVALIGHTASLGIRWYISGRWPNSNMFEAVHTTAWFGSVAALLLEIFTRRTPMRNLFALGSSMVSMTALMAAYFLPAQLDSTINNKMAALNDVWLYIHTNMIILAYALIGLACVTALLFLRNRWCMAWDEGGIPRWRLIMIPVAFAALNFSAYKLTMHVIDKVHFGLPQVQLILNCLTMAGSSMVLIFELLEARVRPGRSLERLASGGASSLILGMGGRTSFVKEGPPTAAQVFDGATMVLMELSFITLWTGLVMGAIWADHSWGRPWGWDPKEVFALNTFLIFLILVHVRLKVRDKGLWTAVLAVVGFEVMMFNWIVVNFVISGLHSYA